EWQVETNYRLLRWDDLVQKDYERAAWWKIVQMYRTTGIALLNGAFGRMLKKNWRFAAISFFPIFLITALMLFGSFIGLLCMNLVIALRAPELVAKFVGVVTGLGGFGSLLWLTEPLTGLLKWCDEAASIDEFVNGKRKDWGQRLDAFAREVTEAVRDSDADEQSSSATDLARCSLSMCWSVRSPATPRLAARAHASSCSHWAPACRWLASTRRPRGSATGCGNSPRRPASIGSMCNRAMIFSVLRRSIPSQVTISCSTRQRAIHTWSASGCRLGRRAKRMPGS
ncbi:MAG TPA: hypothetical protein VIJ78_13680, partial [Pseudolabrys sp.]